MFPGKNNQYADSLHTPSNNRIAAWMDKILPDIDHIYTVKIYELPCGQMYGDKGMFYGDTKN